MFNSKKGIINSRHVNIFVVFCFPRPVVTAFWLLFHSLKPKYVCCVQILDQDVKTEAKSELGRDEILDREKADVVAMLKEQDNPTPGSAAGSIKSEPPTVKEEPENGDHGEDKKPPLPPLNGTECKDNSK